MCSNWIPTLQMRYFVHWYLSDVGNKLTTVSINAIELTLPIVVYKDDNATVVIKLRAQKRPIPQHPDTDNP